MYADWTGIYLHDCYTIPANILVTFIFDILKNTNLLEVIVELDNR